MSAITFLLRPTALIGEKCLNVVSCSLLSLGLESNTAQTDNLNSNHDKATVAESPLVALSLYGGQTCGSATAAALPLACETQSGLSCYLERSHG
jgi:hypothetical protein